MTAAPPPADAAGPPAPDAHPGPPLDLVTGAVGYWRFDEPSASEQALDNSGNATRQSCRFDPKW